MNIENYLGGGGKYLLVKVINYQGLKNIAKGFLNELKFDRKQQDWIQYQNNLFISLPDISLNFLNINKPK